jgi:hypothetical protein
MNPSTVTPAYGQRRALAFTDPQCTQTLAEGMAEFAAGLPAPLAVDDDLGEFMRAHDACHVLFGLGTTIDDEALADTWTMVATDMPVRRYLAYLKREPFQQLLADIGTWQLIVGTLRSLPRVARVLWRARKMPRPWPFWGYAEHLDTPIAALRQRFKIDVV